MQFLVILERGERSYGVSAPDLPGCYAVGETREEALDLMRGAIQMHLEALQERGLAPPEPRSLAETIRVET